MNRATPDEIDRHLAAARQLADRLLPHLNGAPPPVISVALTELTAAWLVMVPDEKQMASLLEHMHAVWALSRIGSRRPGEKLQ